MLSGELWGWRIRASRGCKNRPRLRLPSSIFAHVESDLILTSDDKDPNQGHLFGEGLSGYKTGPKEVESFSLQRISLQPHPGTLPKFSPDTFTSFLIIFPMCLHPGAWKP